MADVDLQPDYYWRNLRTVVDTVLEAHPSLFTAEQQALFDRWRALPRTAQLLHSRLLLRIGPDFRRSSLAYEEVGDLDLALEALDQAQLVALDPPVSLADRVGHFTVPELRQAGAELDMTLRGRRPSVVAGLLELPEAAVEAVLRRLDPLVRRQGGSAFSRAQVVFFGNRQQDMSTFVRVALDQLKYAEYLVDRTHPLFPDAHALDTYLAAGARWDAAFEARMAGDDAALVQLGVEAAEDLPQRAAVAPFRARVDPARADSRVVFRAAHALERTGRTEEAEHLYGLLVETRRHLPTAARAGDRLGLVLQRAHRPEQLSAHLAPLLEEVGLDDASTRLLQRRMRLAGEGTMDLQPAVPEREIWVRGAEGGFAPAETRKLLGNKALYLGEGGCIHTVEEAVLEHLGGDGVWCEGGLYTTLFGLLFWEVIFAPMEGAFQHPFQDAPVDFDTPHFCLRRDAHLQARLAALRAGNVAAEVEGAWVRYRDQACRGVAWDRFPLALLKRTAATLGAGLFAILERLGRNPARHGSGLPDLLVWTAEGPLLVEVKGPGDQPSVEQQLWHSWLVERGVPFVLMRVRRTLG